MKRIAALTMVRNDEFFLRKWVEYYSAQLGKDNLYVVFDGLDQNVPEFCDGVNVELVEHVEGNVSQADRGRIDLLSAKAEQLFKSYDMVIGTDVDEFLVVDPQLSMGLREFLSGVHTSCPSISGLGIDVGQHLGEEGVIDADKPFLFSSPLSHGIRSYLPSGRHREQTGKSSRAAEKYSHVGYGYCRDLRL